MERVVRTTAPLRAPQHSGAVLVDPQWNRAAELLASNRSNRGQWDYDVQGITLAELAAAAHRQIVESAFRYTRRYMTSGLDEVALDVDTPLFLTGHQPEMFHPGVWLKNFAIGRLAAEHQGVGVNLIIDGDDVRTTDVRVPTGSLDAPRVESVPYDLPLPPQPYEERTIRDRRTFEEFGRSATRLLSSLVPNPLLISFWPIVLECSRNSGPGRAIAQARHVLESQWGNQTLELPQSWFCQLPAIRWLICHLMAHLPRFHAAYNTALRGFRSRHGIRNHAQPMPDLECVDEWLEAPLWTWSCRQPTRRKLFVREEGDSLEVSDRAGWQVQIPLSDDSDCGAAVSRLVELEEQGFKIRTRALVTTLLARLLGCDVFVHGIGGARYDEVTDDLIRDFFGHVPPKFMTATGTLHLPVPLAPSGGRDPQYWKRRLHELRFHPEAFLPIAGIDSAQKRAHVQLFVDQKKHAIRLAKTPQNARRRHVAIESANQTLQEYVAGLQREAQQGLEAARRIVRVRRILLSREYAYCLHTAESLQSLLYLTRRTSSSRGSS